MTKQFVIAALTLGAIVLGTNNAKAQNTTATTTVNITLNDVISIDAGSTAIGNTVDFNYATAADYNSDQTINKANSLKVTSTKNFNVKVKAGGANFMNGTNLIPVNVLTIKAATASGTMGGTKSAVVLSATDQTLVTNAPLGSALTLNLDYTIPAVKSSSSDILGKPAGTYTQTVIYTATAL
ncbi:peptidoglycan-binding protein LysM [Chryseobacterium sp. Ch-15]|uniref:Peptidoglycan-binding protein LysM n=1 Tax=Chryseobacterium muglaense TaxID=2893752 RepID=A0A9Q3USE0_9FLAO|nr:peptidoglycan-binding protein LysM [Chryseobacterium muglaense]MBD3907122.1 peptidoglycan-binding protein LysM [Chryseobacterium muglaense]MCC9033138.1 peptidoglycan-binding protein LysM [Chryseobacterium muglaense]MCM2556980.1 peptidoglycan-binding protein LysM [Chryseobacterium muglaense]